MPADDHDRLAGAQFADPEVRAAYGKANYERGWNDARDEFKPRAERAEAAIQRVRELHTHSMKKSPSGAHTYIACAECGYADGGKCPTLAALDSTDPEPAPKQMSEAENAELRAKVGRVWVLLAEWGEREPYHTIEYQFAIADLLAALDGPPDSTDPVEDAPEATG